MIDIWFGSTCIGHGEFNRALEMAREVVATDNWAEFEGPGPYPVRMTSGPRQIPITEFDMPREPRN